MPGTVALVHHRVNMRAPIVAPGRAHPDHAIFVQHFGVHDESVWNRRSNFLSGAAKQENRKNAKQQANGEFHDDLRKAVYSRSAKTLTGRAYRVFIVGSVLKSSAKADHS